MLLLLSWLLLLRLNHVSIISIINIDINASSLIIIINVIIVIIIISSSSFRAQEYGIRGEPVPEVKKTFWEVEAPPGQTGRWERKSKDQWPRNG